MDKRFVMLMLMGVVIIEALVQAAEAGLISKLIHKKRRMTPNDQCPREVIDFWITVPIHDDAKKLVKEAREYYDEGKEVDPNYKVPDMTLGCQKLVWQVYTQLEQLDPCWSILAKDGKNKGFLKVLEEEMLLEELIYVKAVHEAYYACINGRNARQAMVADGVFGVLSGCRKDPEIPSENRGQCLKQAADYWQSLVPLPAAIKDRVEEARLYAKTFPNYQVPPLSQACRDLDYATMVKARRVVPCWGYVHIMGGRLESWIDLFKMSLGAREVQEAHYVCNHGLNATVVMKEKGVYEHIANWYVPTESHEQCLAKMDNYMSSSLVLIGEDIQALVYEARRHYGLDTPILGYPQPLVSVSCKKLQDAVFFGIDEVASCWNYEPLMGEKDQAWSELHDRSKAARRVSEALRACEHGNNAGLVMKQEGIFDEVVRSSDNEPEIAPKGESEIVPSEESGVVPKDEPEIVPIA